jgi:hypothetical protein
MRGSGNSAPFVSFLPCFYFTVVLDPRLDWDVLGGSVSDSRPLCSVCPFSGGHPNSSLFLATHLALLHLGGVARTKWPDLQGKEIDSTSIGGESQSSFPLVDKNY